MSKTRTESDTKKTQRVRDLMVASGTGLFSHEIAKATKYDLDALCTHLTRMTDEGILLRIVEVDPSVKNTDGTQSTQKFFRYSMNPDHAAFSGIPERVCLTDIRTAPVRPSKKQKITPLTPLENLLREEPCVEEDPVVEGPTNAVVDLYTKHRPNLIDRFSKEQELLPSISGVSLEDLTMRQLRDLHRQLGALLGK